jgi:DNA-binding SARP family transcriptional activator
VTTQSLPSYQLAAESRPTLRLLDRFGLRARGTSVRLSAGPEHLLAFLALRGAPLPRRRLAGVLWPDTREASAAASLRSALWRTHRAADRFVVADNAAIALSSAVWIDASALVARSREVIEVRWPAVPTTLPYPVELEAGLLPGGTDDWVLVEREQLRQLRLYALEQLSALHLAAGRTAYAIKAALAAAAGEPLRETAQRCLIRAYIAEGKYADAIRAYHAYRQLLWADLRTEPSPQLIGLAGGFPREQPGRARLTEPAPTRSAAARTSRASQSIHRHEGDAR